MKFKELTKEEALEMFPNPKDTISNYGIERVNQYLKENDNKIVIICDHGISEKTLQELALLEQQYNVSIILNMVPMVISELSIPEVIYNCSKDVFVKPYLGENKLSKGERRKQNRELRMKGMKR